MAKEATTAAVAATQQNGNGVTTYIANGEEVKLSKEIVRSYLTKGNDKVSDTDIVQFMAVCKYQQLNPFLNEAHLVKFAGSPAQIITSKEAYFKRAEADENYDGYQAGIITVDKNGVIVEREGSFCPKDETLVGGWAFVYRKDRKYPAVARVNLDEYDKKKSTWLSMPKTMIAKIAKVQALREAFPTKLGALYVSEEVQEREVEDVPFEEVKEKTANSVQFPVQDQEPKPEPKPAPSVEPTAEKEKEEVPF